MPGYTVRSDLLRQHFPIDHPGRCYSYALAALNMIGVLHVKNFSIDFSAIDALLRAGCTE